MSAGNDTAGTVHGVVEGVFEFRVGDRVACFHDMGGYAEYVSSWAQTTFRLPLNTTFAGASIPWN